jgi:hypothetical protein
MIRYVFPALLVVLLSVQSGCQPTTRTKGKKSNASSKQTSQRNKTRTSRPRKHLRLSPEPPSKSIYIPPQTAGTNTIILPEVKKVLETIEELSQDTPTMVAWMIDRSASNEALRRNVTTQLRYFYQQPDRESRESLLTAILGFGSELTWLTEQPTADDSVVIEAIDTLEPDNSGREMAFTALISVLDKCVSYRVEKEMQVILVIVTDEMGDDMEKMDAAASTLARYAIPVYVIGPAAPFGRQALLADHVESHEPAGDPDGWLPIRQGPESRYSERIQIPFADATYGMERTHSGFGPFSWEYLCRNSGGNYLAVTMPGYSASMMRGSFQGGTYVFGKYDPSVIRKYAPDYVSESAYQQLLDKNAARRALHEAARMEPVELLERPVTQFAYRDEVQMVRDVSRAQLAAARLEPPLQKVHDLLKNGESGRAELTRPRWQAGYDLAMGRVLAARARVEGYNAMLAALKRGRNFENPTSSRWILVADDNIEAGSSYQRLIDSARKYLVRVTSEHAGTPWARIAEKELETKLGWKWTEQ